MPGGQGREGGAGCLWLRAVPWTGAARALDTFAESASAMPAAALIIALQASEVRSAGATAALIIASEHVPEPAGGQQHKRFGTIPQTARLRPLYNIQCCSEHVLVAAMMRFSDPSLESAFRSTYAQRPWLDALLSCINLSMLTFAQLAAYGDSLNLAHAACHGADGGPDDAAGAAGHTAYDGRMWAWTSKVGLKHATARAHWAWAAAGAGERGGMRPKPPLPACSVRTPAKLPASAVQRMPVLG